MGGYCGPSVARQSTPWTTARCPAPRQARSRASSATRPDPNTFGPFDPLVLSTLLSDGNLNAGDAPMPAARVDVQIAKNTGGTDIGGVGSLEPADKAEVYSRNTLGNGRLPTTTTRRSTRRTSRPRLVPGSRPESTGRRRGTISAASWSMGSTTYWDFAEVLRTEVARPTQCLRRSDQAPAYRLTPAGAQNVAVYTDEHGEAQVEYNPAPAPTTTPSGRSRTPTAAVTSRTWTSSARSVITATARYPYQQVSDTAKPSSPLTKEVRSLFTKYLVIYPKGPGDANSNARIVVAHAQDVDGQGVRRTSASASTSTARPTACSGTPDSLTPDVLRRWLGGSAEGPERRVPLHGCERQRRCRGPQQRPGE